jgi:hypothetical protein
MLGEGGQTKFALLQPGLAISFSLDCIQSHLFLVCWPGRPSAAFPIAACHVAWATADAAASETVETPGKE